MNKIKFSHIYIKMPRKIQEGQDIYAKLLAVLPTTTEQLSNDFIEYDTTTTEGGRYNLPSGRIIVLLLQSSSMEFDRGELWTTIRRWTPEKEAYYRSKIGQGFEIEVTE